MDYTQYVVVIPVRKIQDIDSEIIKPIPRLEPTYSKMSCQVKVAR